MMSFHHSKLTPSNTYLINFNTTYNQINLKLITYNLILTT